MKCKIAKMRTYSERAKLIMNDKTKKILLGLVIIVGATALIWSTTKGKTTPEAVYPNKPVTAIVPWSAGGVTDVAARMYLPQLEKHLGQPVTIVNAAGASGATGTEQALAQEADGYTIIFSAETPATFQTMGLSEKSYNDISVLMMMVNDPKVVVVDKNSKYNTMEELAADIKANPTKIRMSYTGPGASGHIQGLLYDMAGLKITMTPFGGGNEALTAVMGGMVEFTNANLGTVMDRIKGGELKALAVFSDKTNSALEGVPAITDAMPELKPYLPLEFPNCIAVDKNVPQDIKDIITKAAVEATKEPEWQEFVKKNNYETMHTITGAEADKYWSEWSSRISWLLWDNGVAKNNPEDYQIPKAK